MKKTITTLLVWASMVVSASAQSFENYVADPEPGVVEELSTIKVSFPDFEDIDINSADGIMMMVNWNDIDITVREAPADGNYITVTLSQPMTEAGEYYLMINEGALCGYDAAYNPTDNSDIYIVYTIQGGGEGGDLNYEFTATPEEGVVTELSTIKLVFPNIYDLDYNAQEDITATRNGGPVDGISMKTVEGHNLQITFAETQTQPGEYVITIGEGAFCAFDEEFNYLDNPEPIVLTYTIEGAAEELDFSYISNPENSAFASELSVVDIEFPALQYVEVNQELVNVTVGGEALANDKYSIVNPDVNSSIHNKLMLYFTPALTSEEKASVQIVFLPNSLKATDSENNDNLSSNANAIEINYTLAPEVKQDLTFILANSTKLNENGELSAEKQLNSFFFAVELPGIEPTPGEGANVTIKEDNGQFERSGRMQKAYGLNGDWSYFSVNIGSEPRNNGAYTITIAPEAVGDELWLQNQNFGRTNAEVVLHFTLVDGIDSGVDEIIANPENAAIYNFQGIRLDSDFNSLPKGAYIVNGKKVVK